MISPISIQTRGRISPTINRTLTLATIGWLASQPIINQNNQPAEDDFVYRGGIQNKIASPYARKDDEDILLIIKSFLKCQG